MEVVGELSARDRLWVWEQMESQQTLDAATLSPAWRGELAQRLRSVEDGTAEMHDLDDVEREALCLLED